MLVDLMSEKRSLGAVVLGRSIRDALEATNPQAIRLGLDDIAALRSVLCKEHNLGGLQGLGGLQAALCPPESA